MLAFSCKRTAAHSLVIVWRAPAGGLRKPRGIHQHGTRFGSVAGSVARCHHRQGARAVHRDGKLARGGGGQQKAHAQAKPRKPLSSHLVAPTKL